MLWSGCQPRKKSSHPQASAAQLAAQRKLNNGHPRVAIQIYRMQNSKDNVYWIDSCNHSYTFVIFIPGKYLSIYTWVDQYLNKKKSMRVIQRN